MESGKGKLCKVTVGGNVLEIPAGTRFEEIAREQQKTVKDRILLVFCNGELRELMSRVEEDCELRMITARDKPGYQTLERSTVFLMMKAFSELPVLEQRGHVIVDFSAGAGLFCRFSDTEVVPAELLKKVEKRMRELSEAAIPLKKSTIRTEDAIRLFRDRGMTSKEKLFRFRRSSRVNVYDLDGYKDYFYGYMVPDTSYVTMFALTTYEKGFILKIPTMKDPSRLENVAVSRKVFRQLYDTTIQAEKLGLAYVAGLNEYVAQGKARDLILCQEALMEK